MGLRRLKVEMEALDPEMQRLYESGLGCREVGRRLGLDPAVVYKRLVRAGRMRTWRWHKDKLPTPFRLDRHGDTMGGAMALGSFSIADAMRWFLIHGYNVSLPVTTAPYDMVVESETGLQRVQVKFTSTRNTTSDSYVVAIHRWDYAQDAVVNTRGKTRAVPYTKETIDLFFIVTADEDKYIIPIEAVDGKCKICLGDDYADYKV